MTKYETESLTTTDIILIVVAVLLVVTTGLLLLCLLQKGVDSKDNTTEETIPLMTTETSRTYQQASPENDSNRKKADDIEDPKPTRPIETTEARQQIQSIFEAGCILLHTSKGPRNVIFSLSDAELHWTSPTTFKKYSIKLKDLSGIESGKKTNNFQKRISSEAAPGNCFSLICASTSIDIEVPTTEARDQLVVAFTQVISSIPRENTSPYGF